MGTMINTVLLVVGAVVGGLVLVKSYQLYFQRRPIQVQLMGNIIQLLTSGSFTEALNLAKKNSKESAGQLALVGIESVLNLDAKEEIKMQMDSILLEDHDKMERHIETIAVLANIATLLGLVGTIIGLVSSFGAIAHTNQEEKVRLLAEGISLAMNSVAYGLTVSLPALIAYSILKNRANVLSEDITKSALSLFTQLGKIQKWS